MGRCGGRSSMRVASCALWCCCAAVPRLQGSIPYVPYLRAPYYVWVGRHQQLGRECVEEGGGWGRGDACRGGAALPAAARDPTCSAAGGSVHLNQTLPCHAVAGGAHSMMRAAAAVAEACVLAAGCWLQTCRTRTRWTAPRCSRPPSCTLSRGRTRSRTCRCGGGGRGVGAAVRTCARVTAQGMTLRRYSGRRRRRPARP